MASEATIKFCDPIRVPANDSLFNEGDPAVRATLTPGAWVPREAAPREPASGDPSSSPTLADARREAAYYKSMHQRAAAHVKALQLQLSQAEARCREKAAARIL